MYLKSAKKLFSARRLGRWCPTTIAQRIRRRLQTCGPGFESVFNKKGEENWIINCFKMGALV